MKTQHTLPGLALVMMAALAAGPALAGPKCTDEPESKWIPEKQMAEKLTSMGYKDDVKKLHVSKGRCWEIYGHDKDGRAVEVYFHPITGVIVEQNVRP